VENLLRRDLFFSSFGSGGGNGTHNKRRLTNWTDHRKSLRSLLKPVRAGDRLATDLSEFHDLCCGGAEAAKIHGQDGETALTSHRAELCVEGPLFKGLLPQGFKP
jgi:hypothetical protein